MACQAFQFGVSKNLLATVCLVPSWSIPRGEEKPYPLGDLYTYIFELSQSDSLKQRYLLLTRGQLQNFVEDWWAKERFRYVSFLKLVYGPSATPQSQRIGQMGTPPGRAVNETKTAHLVSGRSVKIIFKWCRHLLRTH